MSKQLEGSDGKDPNDNEVAKGPTIRSVEPRRAGLG